MKTDTHLSAEDLAAVAARVREAEAATGGEIVPYVVDASDAYTGASWAAAALGALVGPLVAAVVPELTPLWRAWSPLWLPVPSLIGAAVALVAVQLVPALRRRLVSAEVLERRVELRAAAAFVDEEVFATRDRTGVLLFVSLFEHRVVVLADAGIHRRVPEGSWERVVAEMVAALRAGEPRRALEDGVRRCGELLAHHGVPLRHDDVDELANRVRREES